MTPSDPFDAIEVLERYDDAEFRRGVAQIRAWSTLLEVADPGERRRISSWRWSMHPEALARRNVVLQAALLRLSRRWEPGSSETAVLEEHALVAARAWEGVAGLRDPDHRQGSLVNAALDYEIAGYQANAGCLAREAENRRSDRGPHSPEALASVFLQRQFIRLSAMAKAAAAAPDRAARGRFADVAFDEDLGEHDLAHVVAELLLAQAFQHAAAYFLTGDENRYNAVLDNLSLATRGFDLTGEPSSLSLALTLESLLPLMRERSVWTVLRPINLGSAIWDRYLRVLARGHGKDMFRARSVSEVWPSQRKALEKRLLEADAASVVRMPTGAGKTRVAELAIVHTLIQNPEARCLYIAPFTALADEVAESLEANLGDLGYGVTALLGGPEFSVLDEVASRQDHVIILTPEKADLLSRTSPDLISSIKLVVMDEGHIVGDAERGVGFELLIGRLRRALPTTKFLFLSAVVPDQTLQEFADWLGAPEPIESAWRPAVQRLASLEWRGEQGHLNFEPVSDEIAMEEFLPRLITRREYTFRHPETRRQRTARFPDPSSRAQIAAAAAYSLVSTGPVLVFCPLPKSVSAVGTAIETRLDLALWTDEQPPAAFQVKDLRSVETAREWLGPDHQVSRLLQRGVALHHGRMPAPVRAAIEDDFRAGELNLIVATSTLAQGVNLPVRTVIMQSVWRYDTGTNTSNRMEAREYWNIAGRAGRAGHETDGLTIHLVLDPKDQRDFRFFAQKRTQVERVESALFRLMISLVRHRISEDDLADHLDAALLPLLVEEAGDDLEDMLSEIDSTLGQSLAAIQAESDSLDVQPLLDAGRFAGETIVERVPSAEDRTLFSTTGLSSVSCLTIRAHILANAARVTEILSPGASTDEILEHVLEGLTGVTEMASERSFGGDYSSLVALWVSGKSMPDILESFEVTVPDLTPEDLSEFLSDFMMYRLPWGSSAYVAVAAAVAGVPHDDLPATLLALPALIKYGVPLPAAAWAMNLGVSSRGLAIALAERFSIIDAYGLDPATFRTWLGRQDAETLGYELQVQGAQLVDLGRVCQRCRAATIREATGSENLLPFTFDLQLGPGQEASTVATQLRSGLPVIVDRDYETELDRNRLLVRVGTTAVGVVPPDAAQILALEIDGGLELSAKGEVVDVGDGPLLRVRLEDASPF